MSSKGTVRFFLRLAETSYDILDVHNSYIMLHIGPALLKLYKTKLYDHIECALHLRNFHKFSKIFPLEKNPCFRILIDLMKKGFFCTIHARSTLRYISNKKCIKV